MTRQSRGLLMINREGVLLYTESTSRGQKLAVSGTVSQMILIWTRVHPVNEYSIHYGARHRGGGISLAGPLLKLNWLFGCEQY